MQLERGSQVGPYEVVELIASGGMGEVYRARDPRIERDVAIKVLSGELSASPEQVRRFEQEARAAGSLSHPNHVALFDIGEHDGAPYLVYELLEGRTLRDEILRGALPGRKVLDWGAQIARGLAAAHEAGIVHRDLKPENIFVTKDDQIRILDFGLAKLRQLPKLASSPDEKTHAVDTTPGIILGTVGYMSPEQVRGETPDTRGDIFSLGVVLFEMACGARPFLGATQLEILTSILGDDPRIPEEASLPAPLETVILRCLEKNPRNRYQSAGDLAFHLETLSSPSGRVSSTAVAELPGSQDLSKIWLAIGIIGLLAGVIGVTAFVRSSTDPEAPAKVPYLSPITRSGSDRFPDVSEDGKVMVFVSSHDGRDRIWTMRLPQGDEAPLTEGPDTMPKLSPDGSKVLFVRGQDIYTVSILGGAPRLLFEEALDANWSPDGTRVLVIRADGDVDSLNVASIDGSRERTIHESRARVHASATFSPDGGRIACSLMSPGGNLRRAEIMIIDVETGDSTIIEALHPGGTVATLDWRGEDEIVYTQSASMSPQVQEFRIVSHRLGTGTNRILARTNHLLMDLDVVSDDRVFVSSRRAQSNLHEVRIDGDARDAPNRRLTNANTFERQPVYMPDGQSVVFAAGFGGNVDLWLVSLTSGERRRMTDDPATDWDPAVLPDGSLVWSSDRTGAFEIWTAEPDGRNPRQLTHDGTSAENPSSSEAGFIAYASTGDPTGGIWRIRPDGEEATRVVEGRAAIPEISPSGNEVLYLRPQIPGVAEIRLARVGGSDDYVVTTARSEGVSLAFVAGRARWSPDGRAIYFITATGAGMGLARQVLDASMKPLGEPTIVFSPPEGRAVESFGVSPDGRHFTISLLESEEVVLLAQDLPFDPR